MFMVSSRSEGADDGRQLFGLGDAIIVIGDGDLLFDCLGEALAKKFPNFDIVNKAAYKSFLPSEEIGAKLVLFYHLAGTELQGAIKSLRESHPETSIGLVVDAIDMQEPYISSLIEARIVDGVLPLNLRLDVFMAAVDLLIKGGEHFPSALLGRLVNGASHSQPTLSAMRQGGQMQAKVLRLPNDDNTASLTTREVQILDLICKGTQNKIIAAKLHLSENTVKVHVRNIYKKMNVRNRTEAASQFFDNRSSRERGVWRKWDS